MKRLLLAILFITTGIPTWVFAEEPRIALVSPELGEDGFVIEGLPAMSLDRRYVAVAYRAEDGARGEPNLVFEVRTVADDALVWSVQVWRSDETDLASVAPTIMGRLEAVAAFLEARDWIALERGEATIDDYDLDLGFSHAHVDSDDRLDLLLGNDQLVVWGARRAVWTQSPWPVLIARETDCVGANRPRMSDLWSTPDRTVLVVRVGYTGSDVCWEPDSEYHVLDLGLPSGAVTCADLGGVCSEGCADDARSIGDQGCFDSTCCVATSRPVLCDQVPGARCADSCPSGDAPELPLALCPLGVCCAPDM